MSYRRIALKATVPLAMVGVVLGLTFAAQCHAASPAVGLWAVATGAVAQTGGAASPRKAADELLRESRAAIKSGDFGRAEGLISDAEKLGVKYDQLIDRWS